MNNNFKSEPLTESLLYFSAYMAMLTYGISTSSMGAILPHLTEKFHLSGFSAGALVSILPLGITVGSLVFGPIVDRYGYKLLLFISSIITIAGLSGLSTSSSIDILRISVALIGFGAGIINGAANALVADIAGDRRKSRLSLLHVFYGVGALGVPTLLGFFSSYFTYREILLTVSLFLFFLAFLLIFIKFPEPKQAQGFPLKEGYKLLNNPVLLLFAFFLFFQSGIEGLASTWTTTYMEKSHLATSDGALFALAYLVLALTVTRLILSFILKWMSRLYLIYISLFIVVLGAMTVLFGGTYSYTITGLVLLGIGFASGFPVMLSFVADSFSHLSGTAFSLVFVIGLSGTTVMNFVTGVVSEMFGIKYFTLIILACVLIMLLIVSYLSKKINLNS